MWVVLLGQEVVVLVALDHEVQLVSFVPCTSAAPRTGRQTVAARGFFPANRVIFTKCRDERTTRTQKNSVLSMS